MQEVSEEDKREYFRALLGQRPFRKAFTFQKNGEDAPVILTDLTYEDKIKLRELIKKASPEQQAHSAIFAYVHGLDGVNLSSFWEDVKTYTPDPSSEKYSSLQQNTQDFMLLLEDLDKAIREESFLKGAWASLAVDASMEGLIDYSKTTWLDPLSLLREEIIFEALQRKWRREAKAVKGIFNISKQLARNPTTIWPDEQSAEYMELRFPWQEKQEVNPLKDLPGFDDFMKEFKKTAEVKDA